MKKLLMAAAFSAALIAGPASAQMSQMYMGAGVGQGKTDTTKTSWKLYGGMQFNPAWGLELGYTDLGSYRGSNIESWSVAGTGTLPLGGNWSLLGKLGAVANRPHFAGSSNHTDLLAGVGVGYAINKNVGLRLEYEDYGKLSNVSNGNNSNGRNLGLSVKYSF